MKNDNASKKLTTNGTPPTLIRPQQYTALAAAYLLARFTSGMQNFDCHVGQWNEYIASDASQFGGAGERTDKVLR